MAETKTTRWAVIRLVGVMGDETVSTWRNKDDAIAEATNLNLHARRGTHVVERARSSEEVEREARQSYETFIHIVEDNPKSWHALQPEQRARWIRSTEDLMNPPAPK